MITATLVTIAEILLPLLVAQAVDVAIGQGSSAGIWAWMARTTPWSALVNVVVVLIVVALARYVFQFLRRYFAGQMSLWTQHEMRLRVLTSLQRIDGRTQDSIRTGHVVSRAISDMTALQSFLAMFPLALGSALRIVITVVVMFMMSWQMSLAALVMIPLLVTVGVVSKRSIFAATWSAQQQAAEVATHVEQTVSGIRIVKSFAQEDREVATMNRLSRVLYGRRLRAAHQEARYLPILSEVPNIALVLNVLVGGWMAMNGHITIGVFLAFSSYLTSLTSVTRMLSNMAMSMQMSWSSIARILDITSLPAHREPSSPRAIPAGALGLALDSVAFSQTDGSQPTENTDDWSLTGVSLTVNPGEFVALVGPPGSGKTMLVQLLGGFYSPTHGSIKLTSPAGTVDITQVRSTDLRHAVSVVFDEPFLYSQSIRDNIAMGCPTATEESIERAARQACAHEFITALPDGYNTVAGERGLTLSGGQRQRIALARALAQGARVLVFDDATSAIDATTEAAIISNLRALKGQVTVLMVAHRHSTLALADRVAMIDDGRICAVGTLAALGRDYPPFATLMNVGDDAAASSGIAGAGSAVPAVHPSFLVGDVHGGGDEAESAEDAGHFGVHTGASTGSTHGSGGVSGAHGSGGANRAPAPSTQPRRVTIQAAASSMGGGLGGGGTRGGQMARASAMPATPELEAMVRALPPEKEFPPQDAEDILSTHSPVTLQRLFRSVRPLVVLVIALLIVQVGAEVAFPTLIRWAIDHGVATSTANVLLQASAVGVLVSAVSFLATRWNTIATTRAGERLLYGLRLRTYDHTLRLGMDYYERTSAGKVMTLMTTDIDSLSGFLQTGLAQAIVSAATLLGVSLMMLITAPTLALVALAVLPIVVVITLVFRRVSARLYKAARTQVSQVNAIFQELIGGIRTAQMYGNAEADLERFTVAAEEYRRLRMRAQTAVSLYFPGVQALSELAQAAVVAVGATMVMHGSLSAGVLVAFMMYMTQLFNPIQQLSQVFDQYQQAEVSLNRLRDILSTESTLRDTGHRTELPGTALRFEEVRFGYSPDTEILHGVNLAIPAGTTVAVVGETGSGKSTLVKLLARFYDVTSGAIEISDGRAEAGAHTADLREISLPVWHRAVGFVPQETHLFAGTIASNIAYGNPDATPEQITAAARRVGAEDAIGRIPGGFLAPVGEQGRGLSSGQRQLIALARAELVNPQILLLDEATATVDPATERTLLDAHDRAMARRTSVIVAHRLATAASADLIVVMSHGRIAEAGTHEDLVAKENGLYATMWQHSGLTDPS